MRFSYDQADGVYVAYYNDDTIRIARRNRYKLYDKGIMKRVTDLANAYMLGSINLREGDCFIDCGANIGELGIWASQNGVKYHAFEPEEKEAFCCDMNNFNGKTKTNRKALWHEETDLKFYSKPDSADSSAIEIQKYLDVKSITATTLVRYMSDMGIENVRLLKVEAEGAEPEVLMGAESVLSKVDFISVDCGKERGIEQLPTFKESNEIILRNNFELVSKNIERHCYLYRRKNLDE